MFQSVQVHKRGNATASTEVSIAPLIDMVFILLIFFLVTTTFVKDTGIQVERPAAAAVTLLQSDAMRVSITASGAIYIEGEPVQPPLLRERIHSFVTRHSNSSIIIIPDERSASGRLVEVMDIAKLAGAQDIAVATELK